MSKIWSCKIGECNPSQLAPGADLPMRKAVAEAYRIQVGQDPAFIFSGWGAALGERERAVVENREPNPAIVDIDVLRTRLAEMERERDEAAEANLTTARAEIESLRRERDKVDFHFGERSAMDALRHERDALRARVETLTAALLSLRTYGDDCWCGKDFCAELPKCKAARAALAGGKEEG